MIIHRIRSENFLKYSNLDINNLPARGLIAVSGQNESGKTSIGETLCFALFGRTFTLELDDPQKLIRWGESQCSVAVDFSDSENTRYQVKRYLDDAGAYGARLVREHDGAVIAKGVERVESELRAVIGFGYEEFIESFYLAQRELSTPHPHSHTIKVMAGIAPLANVNKDLGSSIENERKLQARTSDDYEETQKSLDQLGIDEGWYPQLQAAHDDFQTQASENQSLIDGLSEASANYQTGLPALKSIQWARRLARFLGLFFFLAAAALWAIWGVLEFAPDSIEAGKISTLAAANILDWEARYQFWVLPLAILFSALFLLEVVLLVRMRKKLSRMKELVSQLPSQLDSIRLNYQRSGDPLPEAIAALVNPPAALTGDEAVDEETDEASFLARIKQLETRTGNLTAKPAEVAEGEEYIVTQLREDGYRIEHQLESMETALTYEQGRLDEAAQLFSVRDNLNIKVADHMHRIKVREMSNSLLDSAAHHLSHRFNQSILKLAGAALPKFTQGRYQHLKIDENLDVRVFSNEKHDFMGFEEISSGTQRQIMLALRLAMSQELISAIETGPQFIFFDEPFAFFDQERIRETLNALPEFSKEISQIWLVAQEFPDNTNVDLQIACTREGGVLVSD